MDVDVRRPVQRVLVLGVKGRGRRGEPALGALCFRGLAAGWLCTESTSRTSPGPGEASTHHPRKGPVPPRPGAAAWMLAPGVPSDCSAGGEEIRTRVGEAQNCPQGAGPAPPRAGGGAGGREAPPPRPGSRRFRVRVGSRPGASGTSAAEGRAPQAQARWRASARLGAARPQRPELRGRGRGRGDASADPAASAGASQRPPPPASRAQIGLGSRVCPQRQMQRGSFHGSRWCFQPGAGLSVTAAQPDLRRISGGSLTAPQPTPGAQLLLPKRSPRRAWPHSAESPRDSQ